MKTLFNELIADDILDHVINPNSPHMQGGGTLAGLPSPQRMVVVNSMKKLQKSSAEITESAESHLNIFDDFLEKQRSNVVDINVVQ